jgi:hypothetical protein
MELEIPQFKIRCSAIHEIMSGLKRPTLTDNQQKEYDKWILDESEITAKQKEKLEGYKTKLNSGIQLGAGAKTYVLKWFKEQVYGKRVEVMNEDLAKGHLMEDEGIELIAKAYNKPSLLKNEKSFENEYLTGTPDVLTADLVIDNKSPKNFQTFPLIGEPDALPKNRMQVLGYAELTGKDEAHVAYTLVNAPEQQIASAARRYCSLYDKTMTKAIYERFEKQMTYDHVLFEHRVRLFRFKASKGFISEVYEAVELCRKEVERIKTEYYDGHLNTN